MKTDPSKIAKVAGLSVVVVALLGFSTAEVRTIRTNPPPERVAVAESAAGQCRGPEFPGCNECCTPENGDHCLVRSWSGSTDRIVIPWYNASSYLSTSCPANCPPCASCLTRYEREYRALGPRPDCDCSRVVFGIDPCFFPQGCGCYCDRKSMILEACPDLGANE